MCVFHMIVRMNNGYYLNTSFVLAMETLCENGNAISVFLRRRKCLNQFIIKEDSAPSAELLILTSALKTATQLLSFFPLQNTQTLHFHSLDSAHFLYEPPTYTYWKKEQEISWNMQRRNFSVPSVIITRIVPYHIHYYLLLFLASFCSGSLHVKWQIWEPFLLEKISFLSRSWSFYFPDFAS